MRPVRAIRAVAAVAAATLLTAVPWSRAGAAPPDPVPAAHRATGCPGW